VGRVPYSRCRSRRSALRQAYQPAQLRQAVDPCIVVGVAVGRRVQRQRQEALDAAPGLDDDVAQVDHLGGGVALGVVVLRAGHRPSLIRAALAGLGEDSMLTVVGGLEFDGWDVAAW